MLLLTRELVFSHQERIAALVDAHAARDPLLFDKVVEWLVTLEQDLRRLRHPAAGFASMKRAQLLAAKDGVVDFEIGGRRSGQRLERQVAASRALTETGEVLMGALEEVEQRLRTMTDNMANLIAVASAVQPIPLQQDTERETWLRQVWASIPLDGQTARMHGFLRASLTRTDLLFVLGEVLDKFTSHAPSE
jgi:hypothetical protein